MSYDLFFKYQGSKQLTLEEFERYFESRLNYKVNDKQAFYENEDTGVYFSFDYEQPIIDKENTEIFSGSARIGLYINTYRPHVFALEAEPEVAEFVKKFDLLINDPQLDGNKSDKYNSVDFIRGWNSANKFSYKVTMAVDESDTTLFYLPAADIERCWAWNYNRNKLQEKIGEDFFVPMIIFLLIDGAVKSCITWSDAIPTVFPVVDKVTIFKYELARSKLFSLKKKGDFVLLNYSEITHLLSGIPTSDKKLRYNGFNPSNEQYNDVIKWIHSLKPMQANQLRISIDQILDRELLESIE